MHFNQAQEALKFDLASESERAKKEKKDIASRAPGRCVYPRSYVGLETRGRARYLGSALETSPSRERGSLTCVCRTLGQVGRRAVIIKATRLHAPRTIGSSPYCWTNPVVFSSGEISQPFISCVTLRVLKGMPRND